MHHACFNEYQHFLTVFLLQHTRTQNMLFSGHTFMFIMVSFLIVTRSNIAYSRFMEGRDHLGVALKSCRELIQHAVTFTRYDTSTEAVKWRHCLARRTIVLLRAVVATLEFQTSGMHAWKAPELTREEKAKLKNMVGDSNDRALMVLAMWTRTTITSQRVVLMEPIYIIKEMRLYSFVSDFVTVGDIYSKHFRGQVKKYFANSFCFSPIFCGLPYCNYVQRHFTKC